MNHKHSLNKVLSNPNFQPPENLFELNLRGGFEDLLRSCSKKVCVKFAINEAWSALSIYEVEFDSRPRDAIVAAKEWLKNPTNVALNAANDASYAAYAARPIDISPTVKAAYTAAYAAADTAGATVYYAAHAYDVVLRARSADPSITCEDQLRRLFKIIRMFEA